ncbi:MAG: DUF998 domain-containing protein [Hyphomicrobium sp.]
MTRPSRVIAQSSSRTAAQGAALTLTALTLGVLALLHVVSPEFDPSWRMVSEYANGPYGWLLALMFATWSLGTWALAYALFPLAEGKLAKAGVAFLVIAGLGEAMAAAFDINHSLHMLAAVLGMNSLPIAALLIGRTFGKAGHWGDGVRPMRWISNFPWIAWLAMAIAMAIFFTSLSNAGVELSPESKPLEALPPGVVALGGFANRFLIVAYCAWAISAAWFARRSPR